MKNLVKTVKLNGQEEGMKCISLFPAEVKDRLLKFGAQARLLRSYSNDISLFIFNLDVNIYILYTYMNTILYGYRENY